MIWKIMEEIWKRAEFNGILIMLCFIKRLLGSHKLMHSHTNFAGCLAAAMEKMNETNGLQKFINQKSINCG